MLGNYPVDPGSTQPSVCASLASQEWWEDLPETRSVIDGQLKQRFPADCPINQPTDFSMQDAQGYVSARICENYDRRLFVK